MTESNYCDDYYDCLNDDCDCDNCNHEECEEHPYQKYLHNETIDKIFNAGYKKGRTDLIKLFDESDYMIIHVKDYGEYAPCCYNLSEIAEQLKEQNNG